MMLRFRCAGGASYCRVVGPGDAGLRYLETGLLRLEPGSRHRLGLSNREIGIVIIGGTCSVQADGQRWDTLGGRQNIFEGPPTALYVPAGATVELTALSPFKAVLGSAPAQAGGEIRAILPGDLELKTVGQGSYRRHLYQIMFENVPAQRLLVGETYNEPGGWSGYPPHKHDVDALPEESALEEVYLMQIDRPQGFGFIGIFDEGDLDEAYVVRHDDFIAVPRGYHPVANLPGQRLGYIWFMAGERRIWVPRNHPAHPAV